jgi:hypothetical protein
MSTSAKHAVAFIWSGQDGIFELAREPDKRRYFTKPEALSVLDKHCYFAPLARKRRGSKKEDVADTGNVLWADIDHLEGLEDRLRRLVPIRPSLVVFSGRKGFWVYLKLSEAIPTDEIEVLNTGLRKLLGADHCHNRDRLARLPGSIHQESGNRAEVVEFSGLVYSHTDLAFLKDLAPPKASRPTEAVFGGTAPLLTSFPTEFPALNPELWLYIERSPRRGQYGYDRSDMEQKLFTALVYQGWTDDEIITFATVYRLPRHLQERMRHGDYRWTERSLRSAREYAATHPKTPTENSITKTMCIGSDTNGSYRHTDRNKALRLVTGDQTPQQLILAWMTHLPNQPSRPTAYRMLKQFKGRYIYKDRKTWKLTELGEHHTASKMNYLMVLPPIRHKQAD